MATGYFIRQGDKTSCGGQVIEGDPRIMWFGRPHAKEGHQVTCGVNGQVYIIEGGVPHFDSHGRRAAGTLDSVSTCPCRAQLRHSEQAASYTKAADSSTQATKASASQAGNASRFSPVAGSTADNETAPVPQGCDGCFQLVNQHGEQCGLSGYAVISDGLCIAIDTLSDDGFSHVCSSLRPARLQIAVSAPNPTLE